MTQLLPGLRPGPWQDDDTLTGYTVLLPGAGGDVLAQDGRVQRPDIEILEAVALALDVRVDDLLDVRDVEMAGAETVSSYDDVLLDPERDARLCELTALRDWGDRPLTEVETGELETLIAAMGRALAERGIHAAARRLGVPLEVARGQVTSQAEDAAHFYAALTADPDRMAAEVDADRLICACPLPTRVLFSTRVISAHLVI